MSRYPRVLVPRTTRPPPLPYSTILYSTPLYSPLALHYTLRSTLFPCSPGPGTTTSVLYLGYKPSTPMPHAPCIAFPSPPPCRAARDLLCSPVCTYVLYSTLLAHRQNQRGGGWGVGIRYGAAGVARVQQKTLRA